MDGPKGKKQHRREIPGTVDDLRQARELSRTADGRRELKNRGMLRDDRHWAFFDALPETILAQARAAFESNPEHAERFKQIVPIAAEAEHSRIDLGPGYVDASVLTAGGRRMVRGDCPTGFVIPIYSGLGILTGLDLIGPDGCRIEGYIPPDGLYLPTGLENPFEWLLDRASGGLTPAAVHVVSDWRSLIRASALDDSPFVGRTRGAGVHVDIAEMIALRPVLVGRWENSAGPIRPCSELEAIAAAIIAIGHPPPPMVAWATIFGYKTSVDRVREILGEEVDPA